MMMTGMIQLRSRLATLATLGRAPVRQPTLLGRQPAYLFVLSHMRGHTSLLAHLLGSHPEISGHSEMGIAYRHPFDLLKLRCKVCLDNAGKSEGRYVLDKILHNDLAIREPILARPDLHLIFMLREPAPTLRSLLHLGSRQEPGNWKRDPVRVTDYYCARLAQLEDCFRALGAEADRRAVLVRAEELIARPDEVLARLSAWLGLATPLASRYQVFESTGQAGMSDPLGPIKAGRILAHGDAHADIALDPGLEARAAAAYAQFALAVEPRGGPGAAARAASAARQAGGRP